MTVKERLTVQEFLKVVGLPENEGKRLELIEGVIIEMAPSSKKNTVLAIRFAYLLSHHVNTSGLTGYVSGSDGGFQLGPDTVRLPDVAYISKERAGGLTGVNFPAAPELAIEIISPSESSVDVHDKARAYLEAGTKAVWAVHPDARTIDIYTLIGESDLRVQTLKDGQILDAGDILPGFTLKLWEFFSVLDE